MNNLFLFTGEETFLLNQQIQAWREAFREKHGGDMNLSFLDGLGTSLSEIISQVEAIPFLAEKRLIFIENLPEVAKVTTSEKAAKKEEEKEENQKKLIDYLEKIPETSVVIFVQPKPDKRKSLYKKLVQLAIVKEFTPLSGAKLNQWIQTQAKKYKASLTVPMADYLVTLTGSDLWRIDQELNKLASYSEGRPITREAIDHLVIPTLEANVFHLTDALGEKDPRKAIQNLHRSVAAGENLRQVFYMIVRQFRLFLQIGGYLGNYPNTTPANIAASLKIHPFVARNTMGQLKRFELKRLKSAYGRLLEIDLGMKTSKIQMTTDNQDELAMAIEKFILEFCR